MDSDQANDYKKIKQLAQWMDIQFKGPWGIRFGLDPLIGLIPVLGGLITRSISVYIVYIGMKLSQGSLLLLYKMSFNILIEAIVEMVPFLGSLFDLYYKANLKNIHLIDSYVSQPHSARRQIKLHLGRLVFFLLVIILVTLIASYLAFKTFIAVFG